MTSPNLSEREAVFQDTPLISLLIDGMFNLRIFVSDDGFRIRCGMTKKISPALRAEPLYEEGVFLIFLPCKGRCQAVTEGF
jgi:hypothetical protein